ncbi:phosphatidate cytidylyltransferase [candidate division WOR-3 bacterium]|nr:phosphatidate cytidylyltransferase [candidate division WOR-3 bacterium]
MVKKTNIVYRLITAFLFIPAFIFIIYKGGVYFLILIELGIFIGTFEFYDILRAKKMQPYKKIGITAAIILCLTAYFQSYVFTYFTFTMLIIMLSISELFRKEQDSSINHIATTIFGILYISWLLSHLISLRELPTVTGRDYSIGATYVLIPFCIGWGYDTGAFFIGKKFGKRKLLERVSPSKTWEGAIGGFLLSLCFLFAYQQLFRLTYLTNFDVIILALIGSGLAQAGDFVESLIKRDAKIKDSALYIPGHGGILDRFDSILFVAPFVYYFLRFFAER